MVVARAAEVDDVVDHLCRWASMREDIRALALVGSWARGAARADSDVDVMLLTVEPARYTHENTWLAELGDWQLIGTRRWGRITERRLLLASGLVLELNVGLPSWASVDPLDAGTHRVVSDGARILLDPDDRLKTLLRTCGLSG